MPAIGRRAVIGGLSASLLIGAAPRRLSSTDADVIVIGAGLAGLHATALLGNAGLVSSGRLKNLALLHSVFPMIKLPGTNPGWWN